MSEDLFNHTQAFQQAIATTITCRTLIKYNSNLSAEQKTEILNEIETTLTFLGKRLETNASIEAGTALSPEKLADLLIPATEAGRIADDDVQAAQPLLAQQDKREQALHQIYQLYQAYLSKEPGKGLEAIETRYKTVMTTLDRLEELASLRSDTTASDLTLGDLLCRVRGFITALYAMFREFASLFARVVEGQSIDIDTEAMVLLQDEREAAVYQAMYDITPLVRIYEKQCRVQQSRGKLHESARDAIAFLVFLQESLAQTFARRQEVITQITGTASLLNELVALLTDYELAVTRLMQAPSESR